MKKQRKIIILIVLLVFGVSIDSLVMAQDSVPPFPEEPPWYISIEGLDDFSLTCPTAIGTYIGSDVFSVGVNWPSGATVSGDISAFTPSLTNAAVADIVDPLNGNVPQGVTNCTVEVQVDIVLFDEPGTYQALLTITVINNP